MPPKRWPELLEESNFDVNKVRFAFFKEHSKADQLEVTEDGIPLSATYHSAEYGNVQNSVPFLGGKPKSKKDPGGLHRVKVSGNGIWIDGKKLEGVVDIDARVNAGSLSTVTVEMHCILE